MNETELALEHAREVVRLLELTISEGEAPETEPPVKSDHLVALCVGHSRSGDNGAVSVAGVSEWRWNQPFVNDLQIELRKRGIDSFVVDYYEGNDYGAAMSWLAEELKDRGATVAGEFHFNSANAEAEGHEALYWHTSSKSKELAEFTVEEQHYMFPRPHNRGAKSRNSSHRGSGFLSKTHCPAIILEPFFGSNMEDWELYNERTGDLVKANANSFERFCNKYPA